MNRILMICFIMFAVFTGPAGAEECARYGDGTYGYSICVPGSWKKSYRDIGYKHVFTVTRGTAEIVSSASRMDDDEREKWQSWENWYVKGIGGGLMNIIETKEVAAGRGSTIKLIVFQYNRRGTTLLQRTMLMKYRNNLLVVECRAPLRSFSKNTDLFNRVMSSAEVSGSFRGNSMEVLKQEPVRKKSREEKDGQTVIFEKKKPDTGGEIKPDAADKTKPDTGGEIKPDATDKTKPDTGGEKKSDTTKPDAADTRKADSMADTPESRKVIEEELKKLEKLEEKGIIEKVEGGGAQPDGQQK